MLDSKTKLVVAARELYETKGASSISVKDIADHAGVTRSLFYHYFSNKSAITGAVLDSYVKDYVEAIRHWFDTRPIGDVKGSLRQLLGVFRTRISEASLFDENLVSSEHASLYLDYLNRSADELAGYLYEIVVEEYATKYSVPITCRPETFYVLFTGVITYLRHHPDADDDILMEILISTLHLDPKD